MPAQSAARQSAFVIIAISLVAMLSRAALASDAAGFVIRLGRDTTSVERWTRSPGRIEVDQVGRSPRVLKRHFVYSLAGDGGLDHFELTLTDPTAPAGSPPVQHFNASFTADSMRLDYLHGADPQTKHLAYSRRTIMLAGSSACWVMYDEVSARLFASRADSLHWPSYYLLSDTLSWIVARRLGRDSVDIQNEFDHYHARVDRAGHILHLIPMGGTAQFTVDRVPSVDPSAFLAPSLAAQQRSGAMGAFSARDTVQASAGAASLWIDYGRPSKRGREIFGALVPWGKVWRTGANAATQFKTDRALQMNGVTVPAGFYSLWSVPTPDGWKLIVNGETGQWGTDHHADRDLYTVDMRISALAPSAERFTIRVDPSATGGTLYFEWDTRRGAIPFTVVP